MHAAWETRLALNPNPSLGYYSPATDEFLTSQRLLRRAPQLVRGTAWLLRRVFGIDIPPLGRNPNMQVDHDDDNDHDHRRCYTKFSMILDLILNMVFVVVGVTMLGVSAREDPHVPLRIWACGYVVSCVVHIVCVVVRKKEVLGFGGFENWIDESDFGEHIRCCGVCVFGKILGLIDLVVGWLILVGDSPIALPDAPRLFWLCAAFLLCDIMSILVALAATCLYCFSLCCCMPCMLAILPALTDEDGATEEEINSLPKFKFRGIDDSEIVNSQLEESSRSEAECDAIAPNERVISQDHNYLQECGICLEAYENGEEVRQLPCHHQFHSACIDTWIRKRTICPMCKFDMLKPIYGRYGDHSIMV